MRTPSLTFVLTRLLVAGGAFAQVLTTTLPFLDGDTLVISVGTNVAGLPTTATIRTVTGTATGVLTTPILTTPLPGASSISSSASRTTALTTPLVTTPLTSARSTSRSTSAAAGAITSGANTGPRVGQDTALPPPMRTTTYYYDTGNGYWTVATWTASVTAAPNVATALAPQGTVQDYPQYQTSVNKNVLASAQASASRGAAQPRAAVAGQEHVAGGLLGWAIMGAGAVIGAGLAL